MIDHPFEPIYHSHSRILILGSFPSVRSREENFYYGHPQNRFWKVISCLTGHKLPETIEEKKELLACEGIALWDVVKSCDIDQSKDSSIMNPVANDLSVILSSCHIEAIFTNGKKADELYRKLCYPQTRIKSQYLPSTSPANGHYSLERLMWEWSVILKYLK
ncbi:MAG TPA: DNA-deoxyinosine glycosylase [Clostridiaceae bacterium]|nr:DNA-deoxyinosine glycosylase [Clostridiaceae bacterium]